MITYALLGD